MIAPKDSLLLHGGSCLTSDRPSRRAHAGLACLRL